MENCSNNSPIKKDLKVYYGIRKTNKIIKDLSICVIFENDNHNPQKNLSFVKKVMHLCYTRVQTEGEAQDSINQVRTFSIYELKYLKKPYLGDWKLALEHNSLKDQYNVSKEERLLITQKLTSQILLL